MTVHSNWRHFPRIVLVAGAAIGLSACAPYPYDDGGYGYAPGYADPGYVAPGYAEPAYVPGAVIAPSVVIGGGYRGGYYPGYGYGHGYERDGYRDRPHDGYRPQPRPQSGGGFFPQRQPSAPHASGGGFFPQRPQGGPAAGGGGNRQVPAGSIVRPGGRDPGGPEGPR